jgi:putative transposase
MSKEKSPSFIHEFRLILAPQEIKTLNTRLDVARQIYNACLGEALRRLRLMRQSTIYTQALKTPKQTQQRTKLFNQASTQYAFREYALHSYVKTLCKGNWLSTHIDSSTAQALATRAFKSVLKYALGKSGRPRFKGKNSFSSIEGKSNQAGIRWRNGKVEWKGLTLKVDFDWKDKHGVEAHALGCRTKFVRLICRTKNGSSVWSMQLVQEGKPCIKAKNHIANDVVGLDLGPSTIAVVSSSKATLQAFCPKLDDRGKEISRMQRKMQRSQRANNPDNFEKTAYKQNKNGKTIKKLGKVKKGPKSWSRSKKYRITQHKAANLQRKLAAARATAHGALVNGILKLGKTIKTEKLSYKSFQKLYGKSIQRRAPGLFLEKLRHKAANAGGEVIEFSTRTTALSQTCQCGNKQKKQLKDRWHHCTQCGIYAQRDLYSAYLARFVNAHRLDTIQAAEAWAGAGILLEQAVSNLNKTAIGGFCPASFGLGQSQSRLSVKKESVQHKALDVVDCKKLQSRAKESAVLCS